MKKLLICPKCELDSRTNVLKYVGNGFGIEIRRIPFIVGEILDNGDLKIKRAHKGYTIISGNDYTAYCERCNEPVYRKEVANGTIQMSLYRFAWLRGTISNPEVGTVGAPSYQAQA